MTDEKDYFVHELAVVEEGAKIGKGTRIWHHAHIRTEAEIGENCNIGKDVYVGKGVKIGNNVKIQNRVSVYEGVTVDDDVFLGPHMTFTNDRWPRAFNEHWKLIPTHVKKGASIGANSVILCGTTIGEYAMVGMGSVVTKDVPPFTLVYGNPARIRGFVCYCGPKLEKIVEKTDEHVVFQCQHCGRKVTIPRELYDQVEK